MRDSSVPFPGIDYPVAQVAVGCMLITLTMQKLRNMLFVHVDSGELEANVRANARGRNKNA